MKLNSTTSNSSMGLYTWERNNMEFYQYYLSICAFLTVLLLYVIYINGKDHDKYKQITEYVLLKSDHDSLLDNIALIFICLKHLEYQYRLDKFKSVYIKDWPYEEIDHDNYSGDFNVEEAYFNEDFQYYIDKIKSKSEIVDDLSKSINLQLYSYLQRIDSNITMIEEFEEWNPAEIMSGILESQAQCEIMFNLIKESNENFNQN